jgi:hypothetical protein
MNDMERIISDFIDERALMKIPVGNLYDQARYLQDKGMVKVAPYLQPIAFVDPTTRDIPQVFNGDQLKVSPGELSQTETATAGDATITLPSTGMYSIDNIIASGVMDTGVANRTFRIAMEDVQPTPASSAARSIETSVITSSASQHFQFTMPPRPYHFTNDHGTIAIVADENPLPYTVAGAATIIIENSAANYEAGDVVGITARYHRVG